MQTQSKEIFNITGKVLPVTLEKINICAELEDGTVIESKQQIPEVVGETMNKISRIYIKPTNCMPAPGVLDAIKEVLEVIKNLNKDWKTICLPILYNEDDFYNHLLFFH